MKAPEAGGDAAHKGAGPAPSELSGEQRPAGRWSALTAAERAALVERMLPAYRRLLRSGDHITAQDEGDTVSTQES